MVLSRDAEIIQSSDGAKHTDEMLWSCPRRVFVHSKPSKSHNRIVISAEHDAVIRDVAKIERLQSVTKSTGMKADAKMGASEIGAGVTEDGAFRVERHVLNRICVTLQGLLIFATFIVPDLRGTPKQHDTGLDIRAHCRHFMCCGGVVAVLWWLVLVSWCRGVVVSWRRGGGGVLR